MAAANLTDDLDYEIWAPVTKTTLIEKGLWDVVENGVPPDPSKIPELAATIQAGELSKWRDLAGKDMKALQILQSSLPNSVFRKTLSASSAKEAWDLLRKGNEQKSKLGRLEKRFEELRMEEGETFNDYIDRVKEIVEQLRRLNISKSDYEVTKKVLNSLSAPYNTISPVLDEHMYPEKMTLDSIVEFFEIYHSIAEETMLFTLNQMSLQPKNNAKAGARKAKPRKGECFQCGERGHKARDCKRKNEQEVAKEAEEEEIGVDYLMLVEESYGEFSFDEDMWMIYAESTTNHMTPYEKYFTALDRTQKGKVGLVDGKFLMVEGVGDVKIVMKEGKKKTIKNVLFVPELNRNVLSLDQMIARGYSVITKQDGCSFLDRTGAVFGENCVGRERSSSAFVGG
ncbi:unnamed protein product [Microthlaspi erraticum]|uniref:CCHC-type domain-containing protein n=1 Tax=Microthlaspi erraticum TaxID=1685480 RepID=A0A6D2HB54_9BRAS|nr:unnamed protein product [Microthlaspi erraticum]